MPKSRIRKKGDFTPPPRKSSAGSRSALAGWRPPWYLAAGVGLRGSSSTTSRASSVDFVSALGAWNIVIGFGFIFAGLMVATRWK